MSEDDSSKAAKGQQHLAPDEDEEDVGCAAAASSRTMQRRRQRPNRHTSCARTDTHALPPPQSPPRRPLPARGRRPQSSRHLTWWKVHQSIEAEADRVFEPVLVGNLLTQLLVCLHAARNGRHVTAELGVALKVAEPEGRRALTKRRKRAQLTEVRGGRAQGEREGIGGACR